MIWSSCLRPAKAEKPDSKLCENQNCLAIDPGNISGSKEGIGFLPERGRHVRYKATYLELATMPDAALAICNTLQLRNDTGVLAQSWSV